MHIRVLDQPVVDPAFETRIAALLEHYRVPVARLVRLYERDCNNRPDPGNSVEDRAQSDDERARLLAALRRLPPVQRAVARAELVRRLGPKQKS